MDAKTAIFLADLGEKKKPKQVVRKQPVDKNIESLVQMVELNSWLEQKNNPNRMRVILKEEKQTPQGQEVILERFVPNIDFFAPSDSVRPNIDTLLQRIEKAQIESTFNKQPKLDTTKTDTTKGIGATIKGSTGVIIQPPDTGKTVSDSLKQLSDTLANVQQTPSQTQQKPQFEFKSPLNDMLKQQQLKEQQAQQNQQAQQTEKSIYTPLPLLSPSSLPEGFASPAPDMVGLAFEFTPYMQKKREEQRQREDARQRLLKGLEDYSKQKNVFGVENYYGQKEQEKKRINDLRFTSQEEVDELYKKAVEQATGVNVEIFGHKEKISLESLTNATYKFLPSLLKTYADAFMKRFRPDIYRYIKLDELRSNKTKTEKLLDFTANLLGETAGLLAFGGAIEKGFRTLGVVGYLSKKNPRIANAITAFLTGSTYEGLALAPKVIDKEIPLETAIARTVGTGLVFTAFSQVGTKDWFNVRSKVVPTIMPQSMQGKFKNFIPRVTFERNGVKYVGGFLKDKGYLTRRIANWLVDTGIVTTTSEASRKAVIAVNNSERNNTPLVDELQKEFSNVDLNELGISFLINSLFTAINPIEYKLKTQLKDFRFYNEPPLMGKESGTKPETPPDIGTAGIQGGGLPPKTPSPKTPTTGTGQKPPTTDRVPIIIPKTELAAEAHVNDMGVFNYLSMIAHKQTTNEPLTPEEQMIYENNKQSVEDIKAQLTKRAKKEIVIIRDTYAINKAEEIFNNRFKNGKQINIDELYRLKDIAYGETKDYIQEIIDNAQKENALFDIQKERTYVKGGDKSQVDIRNQVFENIPRDEQGRPIVEGQRPQEKTIDDILKEKQRKEQKQIEKQNLKNDELKFSEIGRIFGRAKRDKVLVDIDQINAIGNTISEASKDRFNQKLNEILEYNKDLEQRNKLTLENLSRRRFGTPDINSLSPENQHALLNEYNELRKQGISQFRDITPPTKKGGKQDAIQESSPNEILQYEQEKIRKARGERGRVEQGEQGQETTQKGKQKEIGRKGQEETEIEIITPSENKTIQTAKINTRTGELRYKDDLGKEVTTTLSEAVYNWSNTPDELKEAINKFSKENKELFDELIKFEPAKEIEINKQLQREKEIEEKLEDIQNRIADRKKITPEEYRFWKENQYAPEGYYYDALGNIHRKRGYKPVEKPAEQPTNYQIWEKESKLKEIDEKLNDLYKKYDDTIEQMQPIAEKLGGNPNTVMFPIEIESMMNKTPIPEYEANLLNKIRILQNDANKTKNEIIRLEGQKVTLNREIQELRNNQVQEQQKPPEEKPENIQQVSKPQEKIPAPPQPEEKEKEIQLAEDEELIERIATDENGYPIAINPSGEEYTIKAWGSNLKTGWEWWGFEKHDDDVWEGLVEGYESEYGWFSEKELKNVGTNLVTDPNEIKKLQPPVGWAWKTEKVKVKKKLPPKEETKPEEQGTKPKGETKPEEKEKPKLSENDKRVKELLEGDISNLKNVKQNSLEFDNYRIELNIKPIVPPNPPKNKSATDILMPLSPKPDPANERFAGVYEDANNKRVIFTDGRIAVFLSDKNIDKTRFVSKEGDKYVEKEITPPSYDTIFADMNNYAVEYNIDMDTAIQQLIPIFNAAKRLNKYMKAEWSDSDIRIRLKFRDGADDNLEIFLNPKYLFDVIRALQSYGVNRLKFILAAPTTHGRENYRRKAVFIVDADNPENRTAIMPMMPTNVKGYVEIDLDKLPKSKEGGQDKPDKPSTPPPAPPAPKPKPKPKGGTSPEINIDDIIDDDIKNLVQDIEAGLKGITYQLKSPQKIDYTSYQLKSGQKIPPEIQTKANELISKFVDKNVLKFDDIIKIVDKSFGKQTLEKIFPALKSGYTAYLTNAPDEIVAKMDSFDYVRNYTLPKAEQEEQPQDTQEGLAYQVNKDFVERIRQEIKNGNALNKTKLEQIAKEYGITDKNIAKEQAELALVLESREIIETSKDENDAYQKLVKLYETQPNLTHRTSDSIEKQQYSTPIPIAYLSGLFIADKHDNGEILEPSAGNGLLTIVFTPEQVYVNEIDDIRRTSLHYQGYAGIQNKDAAQSNNLFDKKFDGVITNPPFGSRQETIDGFIINKLEHVMSIKALQQMKDNGRAVLIIGGHDKFESNGKRKNDRTFFSYLYSFYNVAGVLNVSGDLYRKQGTSFPIRLIFIDGRKAQPVEQYPPKNPNGDKIEIIKDFNQLKQKIDEVRNETILRPQDDADRGRGSNTDMQSPSGLPDQQGERPSSISGGQAGMAGGEVGTEHGGNIKDGGNLAGTPSELVSQGERGGGDVASGKLPVSDSPGLGEQQRPPSDTDAAGGRGNIQQSDDTKTDSVSISDILIQEQSLIDYVPKSKNPSLNVKVPRNMYYDTIRNLNELEKEVGDIDQYVKDKLKFLSDTEFRNSFSAEQVDAIALAIRSIEKGQAMIVGDMAGIGKGRVAAGLIRYGILQGKTPIFFTKTAELFSDIYRDMKDIGSANFKPFIINDNSETKADMVDEFGEIVYKSLSREKKKKYLENPNRVLQEFDYIVSTYSQFNNDIEEKGYTLKQSFLEAVSKDNILIMDESHLASGHESNTFNFFSRILENVKGVTFLSGTFAKTPENMPIYAIKTALSETGLTNVEFIDAVKQGGVALQEIISADLTAAGQMIRRERSFEGIKIEYKVMSELKEKHSQIYDSIIEIANDIIGFQNRYVKPFIKNMPEFANIRQGTDKLGIHNAAFSSKLFNVVAQLLFSIKADAIADEIIRVLKENKKPIVAFNYTMESFLESMGIKPNDIVNNISFAQVLKKGLDGTLRITVRRPNGEKENIDIPVSRLPEEAQRAYWEIVEKINNATSDITISPLDRIVYLVQKAGYNIGELSRRKMKLKFLDDGRAIAVARTREEMDIKQLIRNFNNNTGGIGSDVLLMNRSASTGVSAHASPKFKDQRQRVMITAQLELDINEEIQKRLRINRTNQVVLPEYITLSSAIPAEQRLLMMARKKLRSLDANTASDQSKEGFIEFDDFLNEYGSQVALDYLLENMSINLLMLDPLKLIDPFGGRTQVRTAQRDDIIRVTSAIALLPTSMQERVYKELHERYKDYIEYLTSIGENKLEVKVLPLQAKTLESRRVIVGKGGISAFGKDSILERVEMNVLKKPLRYSEIKEKIEEKLNGRDANEVKQSFIKEGEEFYLDRLKKDRENKIYWIKAEHKNLNEDIIDKYLQNLITESELVSHVREVYPSNVEKILQQINKSKERYIEIDVKTTNAKIEYFKKDIVGAFSIGNVYKIPTSIQQSESNLAYVNGIFIGWHYNKNRENPYAPSAITLTFATQDSRQIVKILGSERTWINEIILQSQKLTRPIREQIIQDWDNNISTKKRDIGYIITGNILQALPTYGRNGELVAYSTINNEVKRGILLKDASNTEFDLSIPLNKVYPLLKFNRINTLFAANGKVVIYRYRKDDDFTLRVNSGWREVYLNERLRELVVSGRFDKSGDDMVATFTEKNLQPILDILANKFKMRANLSEQEAKMLEEYEDNQSYQLKPQKVYQDDKGNNIPTKFNDQHLFKTSHPFLNEWKVEVFEPRIEYWTKQQILDAGYSEEFIKTLTQLKEGDFGYEPNKEKYAVEIAETTQYNPEKSIKTISISSGATKSAYTEGIIHAIVKELETRNPDLLSRIFAWTGIVEAKAKEAGLELPSGEELFVQSLLFQYFGYGDERPDMVDIIEIPKDILDDFYAILSIGKVPAISLMKNKNAGLSYPMSVKLDAANHLYQELLKENKIPTYSQWRAAMKSYQIIGEKGARELDWRLKTKRLKYLQTAKMLHEKGVNPNLIWHMTGWELGVDGKWRSETTNYIKQRDDVGVGDLTYAVGYSQDVATVEGDGTIIPVQYQVLTGQLWSLFEGEIFDAYPRLRQVPIFLFMDSAGGILARFTKPNEQFPNGAISVYGVNPFEDRLDAIKMSSIVHEIQHYIQHIEGFGGGNVVSERNRNKYINPLYRKYWSQQNGQNINEIYRLRDDEEYKKQRREYLTEFTDITNQINRLLEEGKIQESANVKKQFEDSIKEKYPLVYAMKELEKNTIMVEPAKHLTPEEVYLNTSGEIEARNAELRYALGVERRGMLPILITEKHITEIPREDQIVIINGEIIQNAIKEQGWDKLSEKELRELWQAVSKKPSGSTSDIQYQLKKPERPQKPKEHSKTEGEKARMMGKEHEGSETLMDFGAGLGQAISNTIDLIVDAIRNIKLEKERGLYDPKMKALYREVITNLAWFVDKEPKLKVFWDIIDRYYARNINEETAILLEDFWQNGKAFRKLSEQDQWDIVNAFKKYEEKQNELWLLRLDFELMGWDEFVNHYHLSLKARDFVLNVLKPTMEYALEMAKDVDRYKIVNYVKENPFLEYYYKILNKKMKNKDKKEKMLMAELELALLDFKKKTTHGEALINNKFAQQIKETGKIDLRKALEEVWLENEDLRMEVAEQLIDEKYAAIEGKVYLPTNRLSRKYYISAVREPDDFAEYVYKKRAEPFFATSNSLKEIEEIEKELKNNGFTNIEVGKYEQITDRAVKNVISEDNLIDLVLAAGINPKSEVVDRMLKTILSRGFSRHFIYKRFIKGFDYTPETFEQTIYNYLISVPFYKNRVIGKAEFNKYKTILKQNNELSLNNEKYLDGIIMNMETDELAFTHAARMVSSVYYLAFSAPYIAQQLAQPFNTLLPMLPSFVKELNQIAPNKISQAWAEKSFLQHLNLVLMFGYWGWKLTDKISRVFRGKPIEVSFGLDKEFLTLLRKLERQGVAKPLRSLEFTGYSVNPKRHYNPNMFTQAGKIIRGVASFLNVLGLAAEDFTRMIGIKSIYTIANKAGLKGDKLEDFISYAVTRSYGGAAGKLNRPPAYKIKTENVGAKIGQSILDFWTTFKSFSFMNYGQWGKLWREIKNDRMFRGAIYKLLTQIGTGGLKYTAWVTTVLTFLTIVYEILDYAEDPEEQFKNLMKIFNKIHDGLGDVLYKGLLSVKTGIDFSALFSQTAPLEEPFAKSIADAFLGVPYNVAMDIAKGKLPRAVRGLATSAEWEEQGIKYGGREIIPRDEIAPADVTKKQWGFQPMSVSEAYEKESARKFKSAQFTDRIREDIEEKVIPLIEQGKDEEVRDYFRELYRDMTSKNVLTEKQLEKVVGISSFISNVILQRLNEPEREILKEWKDRNIIRRSGTPRRSGYNYRYQYR